MQHDSLKNKLREMANTPRTQLKRLVIGTALSLLGAVGLLIASGGESQWIFYLSSIVILVGVIYALPGYIGIWLWRMRKFFFDEDK